MPEKRTIERARQDAREGKAPSTQAGEFVREEMDHVKQGKDRVRSKKQAIAIGLSKARRAGVKLAPPESGKASPRTRRKAAHDLQAGKNKRSKKPRAASRRGRS
jgi:predicted transcriptional regulator